MGTVVCLTTFAVLLLSFSINPCTAAEDGSTPPVHATPDGGASQPSQGKQDPGAALPFSSIETLQRITGPVTLQMSEYLAAAMQAALPKSRALERADLTRSVLLGDPAGPAAVFIPVRNLTAKSLNKLPAAGQPAGWLFARYAALMDVQEHTIPSSRLVSIVTPGPLRLTVLPLKVVLQNGVRHIEAFGKDGSVLASWPLLPNPADTSAELSPGPLEDGAGKRDLTLVLPGFRSTFPLGTTPPDEWMPRSLQGNLQVEDAAPEFSLKAASGNKTVRLSEIRAQQPVVLIFGSYT